MVHNINILRVTDSLFTSNKFVREMCLLGESIGLEREQFAKQLGISLRSIEDPQVILSKGYLLKCYTILLEFSDDELLGAGTGKVIRGTTDLMIKSACTEKTLGQALASIAQVIRIAHNSAGISIIIDDKLVRIQFSPALKKPRFFSLIAGLCASIAIKLLSMLIKKEIPLEYVKLVEKQPDNVSDYKFLYGCPLEFDQPNYEIAFNKGWLKQPIRCDYHQIKHYLEIPLSVTEYACGSLGVSRQIKDIFAACPYALFPKQHELAQQLWMSVRTMQRKLEMENSGYMLLKDDVRKRKALFYLEHTNKHLNEIAERCGFSEIASFSRAFTRWTGCSPSKYKR